MSTPPHDGGQQPVPGSPPGDSGRYGPPPQQESRNGCAMAAAFAGGVVGYVVLNFVVAIAAISAGNTLDSESAGFAGGAVVLAVAALGGGALCFFKGSTVVRSLGLGLVFGWSAVSVISLGYCTGLNPELYTGSF